MTASGASSDLDLYEVAYLAGGPERAVDAALVALVQTGRIRVHSPGRFATVGLSRRHPVEAAVLDAIGPAGHRSIDTILWRLADDERLLDVEDRLRRAGLLRSGRWLGHRHSVDRRLTVRTSFGRHTLRRLAAEPPEDLVAPGTAAMAVALGGRERLPDRELCAAVFEGPRGAPAVPPPQPEPQPRRGRRRGLAGHATDLERPAQLVQRMVPVPQRAESPHPLGPRGAQATRSSTMTASRPDLDLYDIAYLAGGSQRVVDTALVALVESGRVRVHAPGELAAAEPDRRHPVEAAVLDAVGTRGHRSVDTIRWRLAGDERLTGLGRALAAAGLLRRRTLRGRERGARRGRAERRCAAWPRSRPSTRRSTGAAHSQVALQGREAMPDAGLRAAIFERPALPEVPRAREWAAGSARRAGVRDRTTPRWRPTRPGTPPAARRRSGSSTAASAAAEAADPPRHPAGRPAPPRRPGAAAPVRAALTSSGFSSRTMCPASGTTTYSRVREPLHDQLAVLLRDHLVGVAGEHERRDATERLQRPGLVVAGERRVELRDHVDRGAGDHRVQVAGQRRVDVGRGERQRAGDRRDRDRRRGAACARRARGATASSRRPQGRTPRAPG